MSSTSDDAPVDWSVYLVRCADATLYAGITTDVDRRFEEHAAGRGAKYLRGRGPLELAFRAVVGERGVALRVEHRVKRLSRAEKESLCEQPRALDELVRHARRDLAEARAESE